MDLHSQRPKGGAIYMTKKTTRKAAEAAGTVVYCGPSIRGVAGSTPRTTTGSRRVERGGGEKQDPGRLIVPLEELPEAMRQLRQKSGRIYTLYQAVQGKT